MESNIINLDALNTYFEYPYYQLWGLPGLYPLGQSIYSGFWETDVIISDIIRSIHLLKNTSTREYIDNTILLKERINDLNVFLDTAYWDKFRKWPKPTLAVENHFIWNKNNSETIIDLHTYFLWTNLYPYNIDPYIWDVKNPTKGSKYIYGFCKSFYDINYVAPRTMKHHDYQMDIYVCSNLFWQTYESNGNNLKGVFFFWYEPYGSVEIGINFMFHVWYNATYPIVEDEIFQSMNMLANNDYGTDLGIFTDRPYLMTTELNEQRYYILPWIYAQPEIVASE